MITPLNVQLRTYYTFRLGKGIFTKSDSMPKLCGLKLLYNQFFLCFCAVARKEYTSGMEKIKTYKAVLLGVLAVAVVVGGGYWYMGGKPAAKEPAVKKSLTSTVEGQVIRMFEGENKIVYSFDVPESASSTTGMEGALVRVTDNDLPYATMYFSFEGGRGYMPEDYISNVIAPRVPSLAVTGTTTVGSRIWTIAESAASEWHVAQVGDGQWLLIVENKKALHDKMADTLSSIVTE
jgi:hypothetical protein